MTTSVEIKNWARQNCADLCGIAPVDRFANAPAGFHPCDIYPETQSVIVIAKRESRSVLLSKSPVPYTFATEVIKDSIFKLMMSMVFLLEERGHVAIPVPSEPYEYWDEENMTGKGILSLKHAGHLAGLGVIGKNSLLINHKFGNLLRLGAILTDVSLDGDPVEEIKLCKDSCNLCQTQCPVDAINEQTVSQKRCRPHSGYTNERGFEIYTCNQCRKICPYHSGYQKEIRTEIPELKEMVKVRFFDPICMAGRR